MIFIRRNSNAFSSEEIGEPFFKEIIKTIEIHELYGIDLDIAKNKINSLLANDKQAIQKAISFIVSNMPEEINVQSIEKLKINFEEEKVFQILNIARALYKILQILDIVSTEKNALSKSKRQE